MSLLRMFPAWGRKQRGRWLTRGARPRVWAHRGASAHAVENTVAAFELARQHGADGVELDVMACASGEVVVFHDDDLLRLGGRGERVAAMPWSELSKLELLGKERIPLLADALRACGDLPVNVEIKPRLGGALSAKVGAIVRDARAQERVLISSFDPSALWQLHAAAPELPLAYLFQAGTPGVLRSWAAAALVGASAVHPEHALCTPAQVAAWRSRGLAVNTWTVDDPARLRQLAAAGVDGVFANDPRAAIAVFQAG